MKRLLRHLKSKKGQALVEYSLILALISVLSISFLSGLGQQVRGVFLSVISSISVASQGL